MNYNFIWIFLLVLQFVLVKSKPARIRDVRETITDAVYPSSAQNASLKDTSDPNAETVISVRITSSVAVGRSNVKPNHKHSTRGHEISLDESLLESSSAISTTSFKIDEVTEESITELPNNLAGANVEFIKQLNAKKAAKDNNFDQVHPFQLANLKQNYNESDDFLDESSKKGSSEYQNDDEYEDIQDVPLARKVPESSYVNHLKQTKQTTTNYHIPDEYSSQNDKFSIDSFEKYLSLFNKSETKDVNDNVTLKSSLDEGVENKEPLIDNLAHHNLKFNYEYSNSNESDDSVAESSIKSVYEITNKRDAYNDNIDNIPLGRTVPLSPSSQNYIQGLTNKPLGERLTTVSFNIVHDTPKLPSNYDQHINSYVNPSQLPKHQQKFYETPKVYSQPAQIYSEPAKIYSEPAKIYSEPAKNYGEPSKIYSEPAKIYSEPAKFYSEPASLHLNQNSPRNYMWQGHSLNPLLTSSTIGTTPITTITNPSDFSTTHRATEQYPEKNYEIDEKLSVSSDGRRHGIQESSTEKCKQDNCKVGYVVEGKQYKKYRVEERTSDGFIVGEYGVVRNEDGDLRGVRYTADSEASPRLIHDALMKFLQLK